MKYILTLIYILFTSSGLFLMKNGGNSLSFSIQKVVSFKIGYITMLGFICYLISFILWQKLLVTYNLSYIVPITTGIIQVVAILIGYFFFNENISIINAIGIFLVILGIIFITMRK